MVGDVMVGNNFIMGRTQKVVVCGARGCGKTSILEKVIYDNNGVRIKILVIIQVLIFCLLQPFSATVEDVYVANIETDRGTKEKIRFYDTAGIDTLEKETVPKHLVSAADGFIIVYSVEDRASYQLAESIRREIKANSDKKDLVVLVLGTKVDLAESRKVETVQALNWASSEKVRLAEVSSLDRHSLYEPFMYLASRLNPPPNKSALAQITSTIKRERNKTEQD